jgi:NAD+ kinase
VTRASVVLHGRPERLGDAVERLQRLADRCGVELVDEGGDLVVVLGGDGTTLRALRRELDTGTPCLGVNFGRVGFLTSIEASNLEEGLERAFAGEYVVVDLPTIEGRHGGEPMIGVNDIVLTSGLLGRMVFVEWAVDGTPMGEIGCDGAILATSTGSTAYNLSAGGPVVAWGTDAFVVSFVSPHSLHARSMVLGRGHTVELANRSDDVHLEVIVDGHTTGPIPPGGMVEVELAAGRARLARLTGASFFGRYRELFSH